MDHEGQRKLACRLTDVEGDELDFSLRELVVEEVGDEDVDDEAAVGDDGDDPVVGELDELGDVLEESHA